MFYSVFCVSCSSRILQILHWSREVIHPNFLKIIFLTPVCLGITALLSLGMGLGFAAITVKYRDLHHVMNFFIQLWFYGTPIVYPVTKIPEKYRWVVFLNPLIPAIDQFRSAFLGTPSLDPIYFLSAFAIAVGTVLVGVLLFTRIEREFVDVI
ncbi:hypothetical protein EBQ74_06070 [bacterium]|nr:hypothetical protein [bacterium]